MNLLAVDSSTKNLSLAVAKDDKVLASQNAVLHKVLSSSIMPRIDRILKKAKVPLKKIDGFVVGLGPGSFTSLRVGLSTVKALSLATGKPVVGLSSLDAIALGAKTKNNKVCVLVDAKRQSLYRCFYHKNGKTLTRESDYELLPVDKGLKGLSKETVCVGDSVELVKNPKSSDQKNWYPQAKHLVSLAMPRFEKKSFDDPDTLVPLYLYAQDCQVRR